MSARFETKTFFRAGTIRLIITNIINRCLKKTYCKLFSKCKIHRDWAYVTYIWCNTQHKIWPKGVFSCGEQLCQISYAIYLHSLCFSNLLPYEIYRKIELEWNSKSRKEDKSILIDKKNKHDFFYQRLRNITRFNHLLQEKKSCCFI